MPIIRHTVYRTTCLTTGRFYIGKHSESENSPEYLGSGVLLRNSINKYGRDDHLKEVLSCHSDEGEAFAEEIVQIEKHRMQYPDLCMNLAVGGIGGQSGVAHSDETRRRISDKQKMIKKPWNVTRGNQQKATTAARTANLGHGRKHTEETKLKISESCKNRTASPEALKKRSQSMQKAWLTRDGFREEARSRMLGNSHTRGRVWINDGVSNKMIPSTDSIPNGWSRGRAKKDDLNCQ